MKVKLLYLLLNFMVRLTIIVHKNRFEDLGAYGFKIYSNYNVNIILLSLEKIFRV